MKTHNMRLLGEYFDYIKQGTKKIEIRLNDEKRENIKIGDYIQFTKLPNKNEILKTKVTNIYAFNNFEQLIDNFDIEILAGKTISKEELLNILNNIYHKNEQEKYGALAIEIGVIDK